MSRLLHSESGRVVITLNEELSRWRRARKLFHLSTTTAAAGTLYLLAKARPECASPLRVAVNGHAHALAPHDPPVYYLSWYALPLAPEALRPGMNTVELWSDNAAMDGWMLGMEGVSENPNSALSIDGGATWQRGQMGIHHATRGEYVVRLRLDDPSLTDLAASSLVWEDPRHPRLAELRERIPAAIRDVEDPWLRARALCSWVSRQWEFGGQPEHAEYTPWDPLTILAWTAAGRGQYSTRIVAFCVHFGITFTMAALALGLPARALCGSASVLNRGSGHLVSEVWMERWGKWCYLDPTCDFAFVADGVPMSLAEMRDAPDDVLRATLDRGAGFYRYGNEMQRSMERGFGNGGCFRQWALWPRNDFFSHPEMTPTAHGACFYCETDWQWVGDTLPDALGMFPCHLAPGRLDAPPPEAWRALAFSASSS